MELLKNIHYRKEKSQMLGRRAVIMNFQESCKSLLSVLKADPNITFPPAPVSVYAMQLDSMKGIISLENWNQ